MRGTRIQLGGTAIETGIIPAYAGNTVASMLFLSRAGDHPRVCGEHMRKVNDNVIILGSSPRMRGTRHSDADAIGLTGIIPAYAGNT